MSICVVKSMKNYHPLKSDKSDSNEEILKLLVDDYHLEHLGAVGLKVGVITQDFIDRRLAGSTVYINAALQPHIEYVKDLIDHLLQDIPERFSHIPLYAFERGLIKIAKQEYSRISNVPAQLVMDSGLRPVSDLVQKFQRKLEIDLAAVEAKIRTKCALSAKEQTERTASNNSGQTRVDRFFVTVKNYRIISIVIVVGVIVISLGSFLTNFQEVGAFAQRLTQKLIWILTPEPITVTFAPTGSNELAIINDMKDQSIDFLVGIRIRKRRRKPIYNARLELIHSPLLRMRLAPGVVLHRSIHRGDSAKELTEINLGDLHGTEDTLDLKSA